MKYLRTHGNIVISSAVAIGMVLTAIGGWFAQNKILEAKVENAANESRTVDSEQDKQIATVVEAMKTIKEDNKEIKADVKLLLQRVK